jgi:hypothetical protein
MSLSRDGYILVERLFSADIVDGLKVAFAGADAARSERGGEMSVPATLSLFPRFKRSRDRQCFRL